MPRIAKTLAQLKKERLRRKEVRDKKIAAKQAKKAGTVVATSNEDRERVRVGRRAAVEKMLDEAKQRREARASARADQQFRAAKKGAAY